MAQQQERPRPKTGQQSPGKSREGGQPGQGQSGQRGQQGQPGAGQHRGDNPRTREEENEKEEYEEE